MPQRALSPFLAEAGIGGSLTESLNHAMQLVLIRVLYQRGYTNY